MVPPMEWAKGWDWRSWGTSLPDLAWWAPLRNCPPIASVRCIHPRERHLPRWQRLATLACFDPPSAQFCQSAPR